MSRFPLDVILNGGEAAVRDRTLLESIDAAYWVASGACGVQDPIDRNAVVRASYGPSEAYRPPQDDIALRD